MRRIVKRAPWAGGSGKPGRGGDRELMPRTSVDGSSTKQQQPAWHALDLKALDTSLAATDGGLSAQQAASRLAEYGPNLLPEQGATPLWLIVLRQFINPLI